MYVPWFGRGGRHFHSHEGGRVLPTFDLWGVAPTVALLIFCGILKGNLDSRSVIIPGWNFTLSGRPGSDISNSFTKTLEPISKHIVGHAILP